MQEFRNRSLYNITNMLQSSKRSSKQSLHTSRICCVRFEIWPLNHYMVLSSQYTFKKIVNFCDIVHISHPPSTSLYSFSLPLSPSPPPPLHLTSPPSNQEVLGWRGKGGKYGCMYHCHNIILGLSCHFSLLQEHWNTWHQKHPKIMIRILTQPSYNFLVPILLPGQQVDT